MTPGPGFFRLFLAVIVFVDHVSRLNLGSCAVYIFFSLSGYWIAVMWGARYSKMSSSYNVYLTSRLWRLTPTFILCSTIAWSLLFTRSGLPTGISLAHQVLSGIFILGYNSLEFRPIGPAWSLDIEVQFYLIAPILIAFVERCGAISALLVCTIISIAAAELNDKVTVGPYLIFFAVGVASAAFQWRPRRLWASSCLLGVTALIILCLTSPFKGVLLGGAHPNAMYLAYNKSAEVLLALLMTPWTIYTTRQPDSPVDQMFGDLSFIVYLLHWPVINAIDIATGSPIHRIVMINVAFIITALASFVIWKLLDFPVNTLRSRWVAGSDLLAFFGPRMT